MEQQGNLPVKRQAQIIQPNGSVVGNPVDVYYFEPIPGGRSQTDSDLISFLRLILSRKYTILLAVLVGTLLGWGITVVQVPLYKARTAIEIQSMAEADALYRIIDGEWRGSGAGSAPVTAEAYLETQLHVLRSRTFRSRVVNKLMAAPRPESPRTPSQVEKLLSLVGLRSKAPRSSGTLPSVTPEVRTVSTTRIVEILGDSPNPDFAAEYVNTTASEFIAYNLELQSATAEQTMSWLTAQLEDMRKKVESVRANLEIYGQASGFKFEAEQPDGEKSKLKDLEKELASAQMDSLTRQAAYEVAVKRDSVGDDRAVDYQAELIKLRSQMQQLSARYTPEHTRVLQVKAEIESIEKILAARNSAQANRLRESLETARLREARLKEVTNRQADLVSRVATKDMEYQNLRRELDRTQKLYEELLQKATEVSLSTAMRGSSQIRVVDRAEVPKAPYSPVLLKNIALGLATGFFLGLGFVLVAERFSHRLRVPDETEQFLGVPELSVVPHCSGLSSLAAMAPAQKPSEVLGDALANRRRTSQRTRRTEQQLVAEAFRNALTSVLACLNGKPGARKVMVTSPSQGEGKSTVISHLGIAIAEMGNRVLLVDGDLRRPRLHSFFDLPNTWGFSTLVTESNDLKSMPLEALAQKTSIEHLYVLTAGPGPSSVSRVLHSDHTADLFERLSGEFRFILIDSPPLLLFSDGRLIGRLVDGTVLVVRVGKTSREAALRAKERLTADRIPVLGTVLNDLKIPLSRLYKHYGYEG